VTPSSEELVKRWLAANPAHRAAQLNAHAGTAPAPPDLGALAARELASSRYRLDETHGSYAEPLWMRALRWLFGRWDDLWRALSGRLHVSERAAVGIGDGVLVLVGLVLAVAAFYILRNVYVARASARTPAEPLAGAPDPLSLYQRACDAANRTEYGSAAVLLFGATVAMLGARGAIAAGAGSSVGDMRRELRARHEQIVGQFDAVATPFVQRTYADRAVAAAQWQRARTAFTTLWETVRV